MFFRMDRPARRFNAGRLIVPKSEADSALEEQDESDDAPASDTGASDSREAQPF
jgi:hypothetical protein